MPVTLTVNGQAFTVDVRADTPLLWVLRDTLGLTGTKYSCGRGLCGSCTVHRDGEAVRSCRLEVGDVGDADIMTIEGLSHRLQEIWIAEHVSQCGYCQPGQIMTAVALLNANPTPSDADIDAAMGGVLCRCGTYQRIREAIHSAAGGAA